MRIIITVLTLLTCHGVACAEHRCSITFPSDFQTESVTLAHTRWTESLVTNLGHDGETYLFMLTDMPLEIGDSTLSGCVYSRMDSIPQFLVYSPADLYKVIIDREEAKIGSMGGAPSLHAHPDGKMVVCLKPKRSQSILGVVLSDPKTGMPAPVFGDSTVSWTWH